jgi:hypothetical protein
VKFQTSTLGNSLKVHIYLSLIRHVRRELFTASESHNFAPCSLRQPGDPLPFDFYYDHKQRRYFQPNSKQLNQIKSLYPGVTCVFIQALILFVQTELLPDYPPLTPGGLPVVFDLRFTWPPQTLTGNYVPGEWFFSTGGPLISPQI